MEAIPHLYMQERKRATLVVKPDPLCSWKCHSRRVDAGVGYESAESRRVVQPFPIPSALRSVRLSDPIVVQ